MIPHARVLAVAVAVLCFVACDQGSSGGSVVPDGQGSGSQLQPEGGYEGESMDELRLRLERLDEQREQVKSLGVQDPDKCEELCELSAAVCDVKTKMCEIAEQRPSDSEYQNLCRVAKQRCSQASQSCVECVQHHGRVGQSRQTSDSASCAGQ